MKFSPPQSHGIDLKKKHGQHFLRNDAVLQNIVTAFDLRGRSVFEIGCGDGALTKAILSQPVERLWVFEIDPEWAALVRETLPDSRMTMHEDNILDISWDGFKQNAPWTLLANLPYQITFPILYMLQANRHLLNEGIVMVQEEVAQKITKTHGRGYGYPALFLQRYFTWKLMQKIPPRDFFPPPKVDSRLLHFVVKQDVPVIPDEDGFWKFIKACLRQPRRTLGNNLSQTHYRLDTLPAETLKLRAQQMTMEDFLQMWEVIRA